MLKDAYIPCTGDIVTNKSSVAVFRVIEVFKDHIRVRKVFSLSKKSGGVYKLSKNGLRKFGASELHELCNVLGALAAGELNREAK